ncbi:hypothetical protein QWZ10_11470 [Paracoccus cavernae]|uniref:Uncharacterized protein n=1 Tax=Paracoccus cavernae TaxID=1571207 RepID=A0ABT8D660_9RHOB|nr:hypothetical protein [Paracoccus cavernae]
MRRLWRARASPAHDERGRGCRGRRNGGLVFLEGLVMEGAGWDWATRRAGSSRLRVAVSGLAARPPVSTSVAMRRSVLWLAIAR